MATDVIGVVLQPIIDNLIDPFGRQFDYLFHYKSNIASIETQFEKLQKIRQGVQQSVAVARRNLQEIGIHVKDWMEKADEMTSKVEMILAGKADVEKGCLNGWCPNLKARYSTSRKASKEIKEVVKLQEEGRGYLKVYYPSAPTGPETALTEHVREFESRKDVEEKVVAALKDVGVHAIGLCGMGGVGKTTMAIKVSKLAKNEKIFDEFVFVVVSHKLDQMKLQSDIAEGLGLTLEEENLSVRAGRLRARIMDARKILIIFDDVWNQFDLNNIGIPSKGMHKGCKVLLTSRLRDVCQAIGAERIFTISELPEVEALMLFKEKAGDCVEKAQLVSIARDVVRECKGLPIALVTVGRSLKDQSKPVWEDALLQLRKALPQNIPGVMNQVYLPLKLSCDRLENDEAKTFFLVCSLFPEDSYIPVDTLVRFGMGLGIFSGIESLTEARNRAHSLVKMLRDRFLLVDNPEEDYVQMHDVIRDVALSIASKGRHAFLVSHNRNSSDWPRRKSYDHFTCISVISRAFTDLPERLDCPKLEMLLLECNQQGLEAADSFFAGMKALRVLELQEFRLVSWPSSLRLLTNLTTLHVHYCDFASKESRAKEDASEKLLSLIAEIVNLEILSFRYSNITVLPAAMGNLRNLRLLDVTGCNELNVIHQGMLSRLTGLEELYLKWSFNCWGTKTDGKRLNASLAELESLSKLTSLELVIPNVHAIPMNLRLSQTLTRYEVLVGMPVGTAGDMPKDVRQHFKKIVCFNLNTPTPFVSSILEIARNAEYLYSKGDGSSSALEAIAEDGFQNLKQLHLCDCATMRHLANAEDMAAPRARLFPSLEKLFLGTVSSLKELCHGQLPEGSFSKLRTLELRKLPKLLHLWKCPTPDVSFGNLVSVYLDECDRLQHLFSLSVAQSFTLLEQLKIVKCKGMQQVISDEGNKSESGNTNNLISFPKLNDLQLDTLDDLAGFCKSIAGIQFPHLSRLQINALPKLKCFAGDANDSISSEIREIVVPSLFDDKIEFLCLAVLQINEVAANQLCSQKLTNGSFSELEVLKLSSSHGLKNLFTSSVAKSLSKLKELVVESCSKMEEVIKIDHQREENVPLSLFPQLESLKLLMLQELKRFCQIKHELELKLLEYVEIKSCPELETFNQGFVSTPSLKVLRVDDHDFQTKHLNSVVQLEYQEKHVEVKSKKTSLTISASDLVIDRGDWAWPIEQEANGESFVVAELHKVLYLDVWGRFEISMLVPGLTYEIVFVIMLREPVRGWEEAVSLRLRLPNGTIKDRRESLKTKPRGRWIEMEVGEVKVVKEDTGDVYFALIQQNINVAKRGLIIKCVVIRQKPHLFEDRSVIV